MTTTVYATVDDMILRMDASTSTTYNDAERAGMLGCLQAASRAVDGVCRRSFGQSSSGTIRYFTPVDVLRLRVPDLVSVSALATDDDGDLTYETSWAATDYMLFPIDASEQEEVQRPYTEIRVSFATGSTGNTFPVGYQKSVKVTGVWGWPVVPDVIREVTILESLRSYQQLQSPSGVIANAAGGFAITPVMHPTSAARLQPYIRMAWGRA